MKLNLITLILVLSARVAFSQTVTDSIERHVDKFPEFNYKNMVISDSIKVRFVVQLYEYLKENTDLPLLKPGTKPSGHPGSVMISFVVEKDGTVSDVKSTFKNYNYDTDKLNKVIQGTSHWKPAIKKDKEVRNRCLTFYFIKKDE